MLEKIENFVNNELNLKLNKKSCYFPVKQGCLFCGYRIYLNHKLLKRNNINRIKKRIKNGINNGKNMNIISVIGGKVFIFGKDMLNLQIPKI